MFKLNNIKEKDAKINRNFGSSLLFGGCKIPSTRCQKYLSLGVTNTLHILSQIQAHAWGQKYLAHGVKNTYHMGSQIPITWCHKYLAYGVTDT